MKNKKKYIKPKLSAKKMLVNYFYSQPAGLDFINPLNPGEVLLSQCGSASIYCPCGGSGGWCCC